MEYRVFVKSVVYNYEVVEAENETEAEEKVNDMIGEIDLYDGEVNEQEVVRVDPID